MTECKDVLTIKRYCSWDIAAYENLRVLRYLGIAERIAQKPFGSIYLGDEKARQWCWEYLAIFQGKHQILCLFAVDGKKRNRPCALRMNPWPAELADRAEFNHRCAGILNGDEDTTRDDLINEGLKCCRGHVTEYLADSGERHTFNCFWFLRDLEAGEEERLDMQEVEPEKKKGKRGRKPATPAQKKADKRVYDFYYREKAKFPKLKKADLSEYDEFKGWSRKRLEKAIDNHRKR